MRSFHPGHRGGYAIPSSNIYLTMAKDERCALENATNEMGWIPSAEDYDLAMSIANSNRSTSDNPVYSRPTFVKNTLGAVMDYLWSRSDYVSNYMVTPVITVGNPNITGRTVYTIAWGGIKNPHILPRVICCYAQSYAEMIAMLCMSDDPRVVACMSDIGMSFHPNDTLVIDRDPFVRREYLESPGATCPRLSAGAITIQKHRVHSHLTYPGPADKTVEMV